ncbi:MAG: hypothetical protein ACYC5S_08630 [Thiobacillus sp.]
MPEARGGRLLADPGDRDAGRVHAPIPALPYASRLRAVASCANRSWRPAEGYGLVQRRRRVQHRLRLSRRARTRSRRRAFGRHPSLVEPFPDGYRTEVGGRGVKRSGGERQRIGTAWAILKRSGGERQRIGTARAILKRPSILIFDAATSALESRTERAIEQELERIPRDRTALVIAHRPSTIAGADPILVTERGRVVERGTGAEPAAWRLRPGGCCASASGRWRPAGPVSARRPPCTARSGAATSASTGKKYMAAVILSRA